MSRWLAVREEWHEVRVGQSSRSGGVLAGFLITRTALTWLEAPNKREALAVAPFGTTAVLSFLSLDCDDRDGWLALPLGQSKTVRHPLFSEHTKYARAVHSAEPRAAQYEMTAA